IRARTVTGVQTCALPISFICVTGSLGEEATIRALRSGATDYVRKDRLVELVPAVRRALGLTEDRTGRLRAENGEVVQLRKLNVQDRKSTRLNSSHRTISY